MKAQCKLLWTALTLLIVADAPAMRWYNPNTGRWLSRDPIQEDGGLNLYVFSGNDSINYYDFMGLTWKVNRTGGDRAHARPESGDTVADLAKLIGFDDKDYRKWLMPVGPTRIPTSATQPITDCADFTIPNTQYFQYGKMYAVLDGWGPIPAWHAHLDKLANAAQASGFNVIKRNPADADTATEDLRDKDLFGWAFAGHGGGGGIVAFDSGEQTPSLSPARYTKFGINFLYVYGCDTAPRTPVKQPPRKPLPYKYSEWEINVSTRGMFIGVWGLANGYQAWSHLVETPGTNPD
jgi:hypothetical protein